MGAPQQRSFDDLMVDSGTPLADVTFCVIDLETTGGHREEDMITEVGAVKVRGGEFLGTFQTLVNPGRAIPPRITLLTGLTDAVVAPAPRIETVLPSLLEFARGTVIVGHNVGFDLAFLRAACRRAGQPELALPKVDTAALARRLVRDEVPDCRLGTLASRLRLDHQPTHRALEDALATTDLLHLLIERATGLGVLGVDDLTTLASMAGHPQAGKLRLTADLPRAPGVYLFCGTRDEVLYVGKATNLRQRVRSYFGRDDRRRIGPMLREVRAVRHHPMPDPLSAEVIEARLISRLLPRYNRAGTRADRYCYVRLDVESAWPRLAIVKDAGASGMHLGPLPSRTMAGLVVDALQSALPLRRCSVRLGRSHVPAPDASPCGPSQLGVAACPCAGVADRREYDLAVGAAVDAFDGRLGRRGRAAARPDDDAGQRPALRGSGGDERPAVGAGGCDQAIGADERPRAARAVRGHEGRGHVGDRPSATRRRAGRRLDRRGAPGVTSRPARTRPTRATPPRRRGPRARPPPGRHRHGRCAGPAR